MPPTRGISCLSLVLYGIRIGSEGLDLIILILVCRQVSHRREKMRSLYRLEPDLCVEDWRLLAGREFSQAVFSLVQLLYYCALIG